MATYPYFPNRYFPSSEGSGDYPAVANVLDTDTVDGLPGTYHAPTVAEVQKGVTFGPASSLTGTYGTEAMGDGTNFNDALVVMLNDSNFGDDASWTPTGGTATAFKCFFHKEDGAALGMEGYHIWIEALTSVVSAAKPSEPVTVKGTAYKILNPPVKGDDGLSIIELSID